jgi:hypothetical protein
MIIIRTAAVFRAILRHMDICAAAGCLSFLRSMVTAAIMSVNKGMIRSTVVFRMYIFA